MKHLWSWDTPPPSVYSSAEKHTYTRTCRGSSSFHYIIPDVTALCYFWRVYSYVINLIIVTLSATYHSKLAIFIPQVTILYIFTAELFHF